MRFTEHLSAHLTPEWRTQYVQYEDLRDYVVKASEEAPSASQEGIISQKEYFDACDLNFFSYCAPELTKIDNFFEEKLAEARRKFVDLKNELLEYSEQVTRRTTVWQSLQVLTGGGSGDKKKSMRRARRQERRDKASLQNFELNNLEAGDSAVKANGTSSRDNSVISGLTRRISSANFHQVIQRTQARRQELRREKRQVRKLHEVKLAFSEFYLSLVLLQNYQSLNFTGFRKLMKKHDKLFLRTTGAQWRVQHVDNSFFHTNKEVDQIITKVETLYTSELEQGDRSRAMKRLRVPPLSETLNPWTTFRVGYLFGLFTVQLAVISLAIVFLRPLPEVWEPAMRMYRGSFIVAFFILLIGINTYGWQTAGVNHVLIFEIDPRHHLTHQEFLEISGLLLIVWATSVIYFLFSPIFGTPAYAGPLALALVFVVYLFNPLRCGHYKARRWLLRVLRRIFLAPYYAVNFADFWLADQLNSLVVVFVDSVFFLCFYSCQVDWANGLRPLAANASNVGVGDLNFLNGTLSSGSRHYRHLSSAAWMPNVDAHGGFCTTPMYGLVLVVRCLPAWFRLAQCLRRYFDMDQRAPFPHLVNAGKYSTTFFVAVLAVVRSALFPDSRLCLALWLLFLLVATIYTYAWDILMDWGLFDFNDVKRNVRSVLRDELVYRKTASYYFAIVEDLLLRLAWVADVLLTEYRLIDKEVLRCFLAFGEAFRRFVWNFFRLENEHLNNCGQFRAVRDIFISPITSAEAIHSSKSRDGRDGRDSRSAGGGGGVGGVGRLSATGTPRSQRSAVSDGGSSSGVGGSSTVGSNNRTRASAATAAGAAPARKRSSARADTPHRYQPKGGRIFSSRSSLDVNRLSSHTVDNAAAAAATAAELAVDDSGGGRMETQPLTGDVDDEESSSSSSGSGAATTQPAFTMMV